MSVTLLLYIAAFILALAASVGISARIHLGWAAFAVFVLAQILAA